jgi:hypothetical protein
VIDTFAKLVMIETRRAGTLRAVGSVREAAELLIGEWPSVGPGDAYRAATRACLGALEGSVPVEQARQAFIAAAQEVGLFVRESDPRGQL